MASLSLPDGCVLVRTTQGTQKMRSHGADITPKLRSVLFLIDGVQPAQRILERAGDLRPLLESQLAELLRLGLAKPADGAADGPVPGPVRGHVPVRHDAAGGVPSGIPPIVGAKMQLLRQLEILDGRELRKYSASLVEARSWRELATRAKDLSRTLHDVAGAEAALHFWTCAKQILVNWREKEISPSRP